MALKYRVASLFAHEGVTFTNAPKSLEAVKELPRSVRDHHIANGNLVEWDDRQSDAAPAPATAAEKKKGS